MRNRPSYTALKVARGVVWMEGDPVYEPLLPEGVATCTREVLVAAGYHKRWHERVIRTRWHRRFVTWMVDRMAPGQLEILGLRKLLVEDEVRAAIADGATQVLVVGAGFDTMTLRLAPEYGNVAFFEVDHPPTQRKKYEAADRIGRTAAADNLHFIPADLARSKLGDVLCDMPAWSPEAMSIVIAEGVLMYLDEADVVTFFDEVRRSVGADTRVVFSHLRTDSRGRADLGRGGWLSRAGLRVAGESVRWAIGDLDPFLVTRRLVRLPPPGRAELFERYRDRLGGRRVGRGIEAYAVVTLEPETS